MMKTITLKTILLSLTLLPLVACNKSHQDLPVAQATHMPKAEVLISDISTDKCLNLEKLSAQLKNPQFAVPAAIMTTDLKPLNDISHNKKQFFSYASFYYKLTQANDLNLFTAANQDACKSVQLLTASNEILTYNITDHSETNLTLTLSDTYSENLPDYEKKVLAERIEPFEYTITYLAANHFKVTEKFKSIDPLCDTKTILKFESTKDVAWAATAEGLPTQYQVDPYYLSLVQEAITNANVNPVPAMPPVAPPVAGPPLASTARSLFWADVPPTVAPTAPPIETPTTPTPAVPPAADPLTPAAPANPPVVATPAEPVRPTVETISVDAIIKIMTSPIRNELKLCS